MELYYWKSVWTNVVTELKTMTAWSWMFWKCWGVTWVITGKHGGKPQAFVFDQMKRRTAELHRLLRPPGISIHCWLHIICVFVFSVWLLLFLHFRDNISVRVPASGLGPDMSALMLLLCGGCSSMWRISVLALAWSQTRIFIILLAVSAVCGCHTSYPPFLRVEEEKLLIL